MEAIWSVISSVIKFFVSQSNNSLSASSLSAHRDFAKDSRGLTGCSESPPTFPLPEITQSSRREELPVYEKKQQLLHKRIKLFFNFFLSNE